MGYSVNMEIRDVKFKEENVDKVIEKLKKLNKTWEKTRDWCRFDDKLDDVVEIFDDIGFEAGHEGSFVHIYEFEREKLGAHENMFRELAPLMEDCEVVFHGECGENWKIVIHDGTSEIIRQEAL